MVGYKAKVFIGVLIGATLATYISSSTLNIYESLGVGLIATIIAGWKKWW